MPPDTTRPVQVNSLAELRERITYYARFHPDWDDDKIIARVAAGIPINRRLKMLKLLMKTEVSVERRVHVRHVEQQARNLAVIEPVSMLQPNQVENEFSILRNDPTAWGLAEDQVWFNANQRKQFKRWIGGKEVFDQWLDEALTQTESEDFRWDWVPKYGDQLRMKAVGELLQSHANQIRFEVTTELLNSIFSTGDGTKVTWRDATVGQHQERIDMLSKLIDGTAETAAMHMRAVAMIQNAGVQTLGEVTTAEVAS